MFACHIDTCIIRPDYIIQSHSENRFFMPNSAFISRATVGGSLSLCFYFSIHPRVLWRVQCIEAIRITCGKRMGKSLRICEWILAMKWFFVKKKKAATRWWWVMALPINGVNARRMGDWGIKYGNYGHLMLLPWINRLLNIKCEIGANI